MKSTIFTKTELKRLNERFKGSKKDKAGLFSGRIRPKINEILNYWFPKRKALKKAIEKVKK